MITFRSFLHVLVLTVLGALAILALAGQSRAQGPGLGTVEFLTSARSQEAQSRFLRGVAALHSFWYPVALEEFRAARQIEVQMMQGESFALACKEAEISEQSYFRWRKEYGGVALEQAKRLNDHGSGSAGD